MKRVKDFLATHWEGQSPLLLGYSGGPDSKALLYLVREIEGIDLHVAHVDHGWRKESAEEAALLEEEIKSLGHVFHTTKLHMAAKNKEAIAREERMAFFLSLFKRYPFQALLLGLFAHAPRLFCSSIWKATPHSR